MIRGSCHCGATGWQFEGKPDGATICNCTVCRRYGVLWAYDFEDEGIRVRGSTQVYIRGDSIEFHFCPVCGCVVCVLVNNSRTLFSASFRTPPVTDHRLLKWLNGCDQPS